MKLFIICGKSGSGKNTAAGIIKEYYEKRNKNVLITEFSKYLKMYASEIIGYDPKLDEKPRKFLQQLGSKIRNDLFSNTFLSDRIIQDLKIYEEYFDYVVLSDSRMPNEIDQIKILYESTVIKLENYFGENKLDNDEKNHETEVLLDEYENYDYIVKNITLENLKEEIIKIIEEV